MAKRGPEILSFHFGGDLPPLEPPEKKGKLRTQYEVAHERAWVGSTQVDPGYYDTTLDESSEEVQSSLEELRDNSFTDVEE